MPRYVELFKSMMGRSPRTKSSARELSSMRTSSGVMSSRPEICWLVDQLPPLPVVLPCVSRSMVSLPRSSLTYLWVDCSLPPRYRNSSQLPTMDSPLLVEQRPQLRHVLMMIDVTPRARAWWRVSSQNHWASSRWRTHP